MIFETERLVIRQWEDKDYKDLYEFVSDKEVTKFLLYKTYQSEEEAKQRIKAVKEEYSKLNGYGDYAIELKAEKKVIGSVNISLHSKKAGGIVSLGWSLNKKYQGKGYMTECVKEVFKYIKRNNLAKRIVAFHDVENFKSGAVMKRCNMTFEGIARKAGENNVHFRCDIANYSILDEEIEI